MEKALSEDVEDGANFTEDDPGRRKVRLYLNNNSIYSNANFIIIIKIFRLKITLFLSI